MLVIVLTHGTASGSGNLDDWANVDAPLRMDFGTAVAAAVAPACFKNFLRDALNAESPRSFCIPFLISPPFE